MKNDQNSESGPHADEDDLIIIDDSNSTRDNTVRPLTGAHRKRAEEYLANLKKYRPKDYEELMKNRDLK